MDNEQQRKYWFFGSKLNTVLLVTLIVLMVIAIRIMMKDIGVYFPMFRKEDTVTKNEVQSKKDTLVYSDTKFGFSFSYDANHPLREPNRKNNSSDFFVDGSGNGRRYECPLPNNSQRVYSELEVAKDNINITGCTYFKSDLDLAAKGVFTASWSKEVYGEGQNIENINISNRPAKLVYGSTDVRTLIISLPVPYEENGYKYDFLKIDADVLLMNDIIATFKLK